MTPFTYAEVGCTRPGAPAPAGYHKHHREIVLAPASLWPAAKAALRQWRMFEMPWVKIEAEGEPAVGKMTTVVAQYGPIQLRNRCRVIETYETGTHVGFSYGTLAGHAMSGEERFSVHLEGDQVRYEILAYSRPGTWYAKVGLRVVRRLQWQFGTQSLEAMQRAVGMPASAGASPARAPEGARRPGDSCAPGPSP